MILAASLWGRLRILGRWRLLIELLRWTLLGITRLILLLLRGVPLLCADHKSVSGWSLQDSICGALSMPLGCFSLFSPEPV